MTLVLSEVSKLGIAMAADSAITETYGGHLPLLSGRHVPAIVRTGAKKLLPIPQAGAAISVWGFGAVGTPSDPTPLIPIDAYLGDLISTVATGASLDEIADLVVRETNLRIRVGQDRGGFHLGGFIPGEGSSVPAIYTIHTGPNQTGSQLPLALEREFPNPARLSVPQWIAELDQRVFYVRNGDYEPYAIFAEALFSLLERLAREQQFIVPSPARFPDPLEGRGRFVRLQVETICQFYRLSNRLESIAAPVSWITIGPEGLRTVRVLDS